MEIVIRLEEVFVSDVLEFIFFFNTQNKEIIQVIKSIDN